MNDGVKRLVRNDILATRLLRWSQPLEGEVALSFVCVPQRTPPEIAAFRVLSCSSSDLVTRSRLFVSL